MGTSTSPVAHQEYFPQVPFSEEFARKMVRALLRRSKGYFDALPEYRDGQDLESELMMTVRSSWAGFRVSRAAGTFMTNAAQNAMISVHRKAYGDRKREQEYFRYKGHSFDPRRSEDETGTKTLAEWLAGVCLEIRRGFPNRLWSGQGPIAYSLDQAVGIVALMTRLKLKSQGCRSMLKDFPELRKALRMKSVPSRRMVEACLRRVTREMGQPRNNANGAVLGHTNSDATIGVMGHEKESILVA